MGKAKPKQPRPYRRKFILPPIFPPATHTQYLVLALLERGPMTPVRLMQAMNIAGCPASGYSAIYIRLHRMENVGMVTSTGERRKAKRKHKPRNAMPDNFAERTYRITDAGLSAIQRNRHFYERVWGDFAGK